MQFYLHILTIYVLICIIEAVPKRILELMNVEKLTRENVASHLQANSVPLEFFDGLLSLLLGLLLLCMIAEIQNLPQKT